MKILFCNKYFYLGFFVAAYLAVSIFTVNAANCPVAAVSGVQPSVTNLAVAFEQAGQSQLGSNAPPYPSMLKGHPTTTSVSGSVPCIILKAVGYTESKWKQFNAQSGQSGLTVVSSDCGYGIMQITSGMSGGAGFEPSRVVSEYQYNIGTGARSLITKWNSTPSVGDNDPMIAEDWYFAVWGYNGFSYINNPNNPKYSPNRPAFNGTQPRVNYPYQELVFGYAANSPGTDYWVSTPLTLPNSALISNTPSRINTPLPSHGTGCNSGVLAPTGLTGSPIPSNANQISISWINSVPSAVEVHLKAPNASQFTLVANFSNPAPTSTILSNLTPNTSYQIMLRAYNSNGYSPFTLPITVTTSTAPPKAWFANSSFTFSSTKTGVSATGYVELYNTGGGTLQVPTVQRVSGSIDFSYASPSLPINISTNPNYVRLYFSFRPSSTGSKTATFRVFTNDTMLPSKDIILYGFGIN